MWQGIGTQLCDKVNYVIQSPDGIEGRPAVAKTPRQLCPGMMLSAAVCCASSCSAQGMSMQEESSCQMLSSGRVTSWLGPSLHTACSSFTCVWLMSYREDLGGGKHQIAVAVRDATA